MCELDCEREDLTDSNEDRLRVGAGCHEVAEGRGGAFTRRWEVGCRGGGVVLGLFRMIVLVL